MLKNINWFTIIFTLEWMEKIKTEKKKKKHIKTKQFVPKDIECFTVIIAWDGVEKMKTEKKIITKQFEQSC